MKKMIAVGFLLASMTVACGSKGKPAAAPTAPVANPCGGATYGMDGAANPCAPANPCGAANPCAPK